MAQSYVVSGPLDAGIDAARAFGETLGLPEHSPDIVVLRYGLFPVEDARRVAEVAATAPLVGSERLIVLAADRLFHEAQNALLKLFEEPPAAVTLVLAIPNEGVLLPTLRSRVVPLPGVQLVPEAPHAFVRATPPERSKMVAKLLDRAKSSKDDEKQAARAEALTIVEDLTRAVYALKRSTPQGTAEAEELDLLLAELSRFVPILHERSAPLKLIFEHLLLVLPDDLLR